MSKLKNIIQKIEEVHQIKVYGDYHPNDFVKGVRFLNKEDIRSVYLSPNILYLCDYDLIRDKNVYGLILCVNCMEPSKNFLSIQENIDLFEISNSIFEVLDQFENVERKKQLLYNVLHSGNGLTELLRNAYNSIENPIQILDSSYTILARFPLSDPDPIFEEKYNRKSLKKEFVERMKNQNLKDKILHSVYPFKVFLKDLNCIAIFESIRINNSVVGYLFIKCENKELTDDELDFVHILTQMVSIQLQKDELYQNPYAIKFDLFLKDLLLGHLKSEKEGIVTLKEFGVKPKEFYFFIVCGFQDLRKRKLPPNYYWMQLRQIFDNSITCVDRNYYITLISTDHFDDYILNIESRLESFLSMNKMKAAISYRFNDLLDAKIYVEQAKKQLQHNLAYHETNSISYYKYFFFEHLYLLSENQKEIVSSIHPAIRQMVQYDELHNTKYTYTLEVYLKNNRNAPESAKELYIHKSTLFYRFAKMEELFNLKLNHSDSLFAYEFSLRLINILKER